MNLNLNTFLNKVSPLKVDLRGAGMTFAASTSLKSAQFDISPASEGPVFNDQNADHKLYLKLIVTK